ncbi:hypothetical protein [Pseudonocardia sp.]|uniref:hypothetical protein n=1 Tax=Pseudonocardia sp. TaxID=60912 RepID=UPI00262728D1|nr:hypothetical protein [Pseudonocardia sp.]
MLPWIALAVSGLVYAAAVWWSTLRLPADGVPRHFDATGAADAFGSRSDVVGGFVLIGAVMLGIGVAAVCLARWGSLRLVNVPHRAYWLQGGRTPRLRRMLATDLGLLLSATVAFLAVIPLATVFALRSEPAGIPPALLWGAVGAFAAAVIAWCVWLGRYRYHPARDR